MAHTLNGAGKFGAGAPLKLTLVEDVPGRARVGKPRVAVAVLRSSSGMPSVMGLPSSPERSLRLGSLLSRRMDTHVLYVDASIASRLKSISSSPAHRRRPQFAHTPHNEKRGIGTRCSGRKCSGTVCEPFRHQKGRTWRRRSP